MWFFVLWFYLAGMFWCIVMLATTTELNFKTKGTWIVIAFWPLITVIAFLASICEDFNERCKK